MRFSISTAAAILAAGTFIAGPAFAEVTKLTATLDGKQQSPTLEVPGKGSAEVTYDSETKTVTWNIEYSDLSAPPAAGHFHGPAEKGTNADVEIPFSGDLTSPIKGSAVITDAQAADLLAGKYYINLHTPDHKAGEIRGQVEKAM